MNKILVGIIALVALFFGVGIGAAGSSTPSTAATPRPAVTVTATPKAIVKTKTVTKTETVVKKVTPQVCLDALNDADGLTQISGDLASLVQGHLLMDSAIWTGLGNGDMSELAAGPAKVATFNDEVSALVVRVNASTYPANRDACRATS